MPDTKSKLLLPATIAQAGWDVARARKDITALPFDVTISKSSFHALLSDVHGVALGLTPFAEPELRAAPNLRAVARIGVGYDTVDVAALSRHKIPLLVTGSANSSSVSEQALFFMLALAKRGAALHAMVIEDRWAERSRQLPGELFGKTVVIVGFGRIGTRIARACLGLGMTVIVFDPYVAAAEVALAGCDHANDLDAALAIADFVTIHCPKNDETIGMFGAARFARMKPSAYLVNTARGGIVDELALHAALRQGLIAGAGLDVFDLEPPRPGSALFDLPNVITAPHIAGVTVEAFNRMSAVTVQNLLDVLDGKPNIDHVINKQVLAGT